MFEKVNPRHPDKVADRIAGALVDLAYTREYDPRVAVEVLIGHGHAYVITESSVEFSRTDVSRIVDRICDCDMKVSLVSVPQDPDLSDNQSKDFRCGDNGIFKGTPITQEQRILCTTAKDIYKIYQSDGKYILDDNKLIICQSNALEKDLRYIYKNAIINPLGAWTGGTDVDTGATNRKLGSDMGDSVTGGGLHGKDLSKADVSVNIYAHLQAQRYNKPVELSCAIGDKEIDGLPYRAIVEIARTYIQSRGGFESFAEWGLIH